LAIEKFARPTVGKASRGGVPQLRASGGRVINVTSVGGIMPGPMIAAYHAAKAAFEAVSDSKIVGFNSWAHYSRCNGRLQQRFKCGPTDSRNFTAQCSQAAG